MLVKWSRLARDWWLKSVTTGGSRPLERLVREERRWTAQTTSEIPSSGDLIKLDLRPRPWDLGTPLGTYTAGWWNRARPNQRWPVAQALRRSRRARIGRRSDDRPGRGAGTRARPSLELASERRHRSQRSNAAVCSVGAVPHAPTLMWASIYGAVAVFRYMSALCQKRTIGRSARMSASCQRRTPFSVLRAPGPWGHHA
jgi:hypothetical protein